MCRPIIQGGGIKIAGECSNDELLARQAATVNQLVAGYLRKRRGNVERGISTERLAGDDVESTMIGAPGERFCRGADERGPSALHRCCQARALI